VDNNQYTQPTAQTKQNKSLFIVSVIGIIDQSGKIVREDCLGLIKLHVRHPDSR